MSSERHAVTRLEVVVLLTIVGTAGTLILAATQRYREAQDRVHTMGRLKQIASAMHSFQDVYSRLPPAWGIMPVEGTQPDLRPRATLHVWMLPFLEEDNLYIRLSQPPPRGDNDDNKRRVWNLSSTREVVVPYVSPLDYTNCGGVVTLNDKVYGVQNYAANIRVFGPTSGSGAQPGVEPGSDSFDGFASLKTSFPHGSSNIIVLATRYAQCGSGGSTWSQIGTATLSPFGGNGAFFGSNISPKLGIHGDNNSGDDTVFQVAPTTSTCNPVYAQSFNNQVIYVGLADGSVRTISPKISITTWSRAIIPDHDYTLGSDW